MDLLLPLIWEYSIPLFKQIDGVYIKSAERSIKLVQSNSDHEVIGSNDLDSSYPSLRSDERRILGQRAFEKYGPTLATTALSDRPGSVKVNLSPARRMLQDFMDPRAFL